MVASSQHIYTMEEFYAFGNRLHYNTGVNIIVNSFAAFIVLKHSTKAMGVYRYYILLTIFCAFLMDFHITFIFGPFNMLPSTIMCGSGFICRHLDHFWGEYVQYGILHITISCVGCSIVVGLFYQLFSLNGNLHFFHSVKGVTIIAITMICYPFPSFAINTPMPDFNETAEYIKEYYNNTYDVFVTASSCHALKLDAKGKAHFSCLATQIVAVWVVGGIAAAKIHKKLAEMKSILSPGTLKARRQLLIALCFQGSVPSILIVIPLIAMLSSVIIETDSMNLASNIAMPIISLHSTFNALSIMYIITPYRKAVIKIIKAIFGIKEKPPQITVENTNSNIGSPRSLSAVH